MKKAILSALLMLLPMIASAEAVVIDGIYYNLISKTKTAEVTTNPDKYKGDLIIPESVEYEGVTYTVNSIDLSSFFACEELTSVSLPDGMTSIGNGAFSSCSMPANDVTVTGAFTINKYKITYIIDGETYLEEEVEYGSAITPPNVPERDGYQFEWSSIPDMMPAYPVTIYGSYTTGIDIIMAEGFDVKIFTVSGKPLEKFQKGVNIIQFKNGKTKKMMVK